jgi:hypothetical protein
MNIFGKGLGERRIFLSSFDSLKGMHAKILQNESLLNPVHSKEYSSSLKRRKKVL